MTGISSRAGGELEFDPFVNRPVLRRRESTSTSQTRPELSTAKAGLNQRTARRHAHAFCGDA